MHTCACYVKMAELFERAGTAEYIPFAELKEKLHKSVNKLIEADTSEWGGYVCRPSRFIHSKDCEFYADNCEAADYECQYIINTQLADGSWDIPWGWNDYPDEWAISRNWWKGQVIIEKLLYLKGMGRIGYGCFFVLLTIVLDIEPIMDTP